MAYRRRYKRKAYGSRRRRGKATKAYVKRAVASAIELKERFYTGTGSAIGKTVTGSDADFTSVSYGTGGMVGGLCAGVANGTGEGQRIGNKITLKGVQLRMVFTPGDQYNVLRVLLVTPKRSFASGSTGAFIQQLLSNTASSATQLIAPVDTDLFKVYLDKQYWIRKLPVDGSTSSQTDQLKILKKFVKFNKKIYWDISNPTNPSQDVFLVAISDSSVAANPGTIMAHVRLWYTDA